MHKFGFLNKRVINRMCNVLNINEMSKASRMTSHNITYVNYEEDARD